MAKRRLLWVLLAATITACFATQMIVKILAGHFDTKASGYDPTTDADFSCRISKEQVRNQYVIGKPVILKVRLTNYMERDVEIRDCAQHYPFYSFEVIDPTGRQLVLSKKISPSMAEIKPEQRTIKPGRIYDVEIDLAEWYDLSHVGRYTIKANWCALAKVAPYARESNTVTIAVVPPEKADVTEFVYGATLITKNGMSEEAAQLKLVEMGDEVVPTLLEWVEIEELNSGPHGDWNSYHDIIDVLSQIGSKEARKLIAQNKHLWPEEHRAMLLKRIDIWQSEDRFERLVEALGEPRLYRKWVIFKLGVLGDKRAIGLLEKIAVEDEQLDIRETAKEALAHLQNPNVPMRYIIHRPSMEIELTLLADTYRIGKPIKINCKITAGPYGSQTLVEFSKPVWHFLPWSLGHPDLDKSQPLMFHVEQKKESGYDSLIPIKELRQNEERLVNTNAKPLDGYINIAELGGKSIFTLKPNESRSFMVEDISKAFKITEPGEYRICVHSNGYVVSNSISIDIRPME